MSPLVLTVLLPTPPILGGSLFFPLDLCSSHTEPPSILAHSQCLPPAFCKCCPHCLELCFPILSLPQSPHDWNLPIAQPELQGHLFEGALSTLLFRHWALALDFCYLHTSH